MCNRYNTPSERRCCINQCQVKLPTWLCHNHCLRTTQFSEPIENGGSDV